MYSSGGDTTVVGSDVNVAENTPGYFGILERGDVTPVYLGVRPVIQQDGFFRP